jgi:hypothetical protein
MKITAKVNKIIYDATGENVILELIKEQTIETTEDIGSVAVHYGWADYFDPINPKGIAKYIEGEVYPAERQVFKNGGGYISRVETSGTWVPEEWELLFQGV